MHPSLEKAAIAGSLFIFILVIATWMYQAFPVRETDPALMHFSNTQDWDPTLLRHLPERRTLEEQAATKRYVDAIELAPPPANMSEETARELRTLHEYEALREDARADIEAEHAGFAGLRFGMVRPWAGEKTKTRELLDAAFAEYTPVIMAFKQRFDRVRPDRLDPSITTMFETPGHPAYPSGHASQAFLVAGILSELDPGNEEVYFSDAARIARNREIAGVHYPSDSAAGKALAEQFLPLYVATEEGKELLEAARSEW